MPTRISLRKVYLATVVIVTQGMVSIQIFQTDDHAEIMAAIDKSDNRTIFVISDISKEESWITIPETEAVLLESWR